jgi:hypothetical protein
MAYGQEAMVLEYDRRVAAQRVRDMARFLFVQDCAAEVGIHAVVLVEEVACRFLVSGEILATDRDGSHNSQASCEIISNSTPSAENAFPYTLCACTAALTSGLIS